MALDGLTGAHHAGGLNHVGVERALHQPVHAAGFESNARGFVVEDGDELVADDLALLLGVGHAGELGKKALACIHGHQIQTEPVAQVLLHALELVFAQHAVVDEDACELRADGLVDQHGRNR